MTRQDNNDRTFVKITNHDIYQKLMDIEALQKQTNGKVKLNRLHITGIWTTLSLIITIILFILKEVLI